MMSDDSSDARYAYKQLFHAMRDLSWDEETITKVLGGFSQICRDELAEAGIDPEGMIPDNEDLTINISPSDAQLFEHISPKLGVDPPEPGLGSERAEQFILEFTELKRNLRKCDIKGSVGLFADMIIKLSNYEIEGYAKNMAGEMDGEDLLNTAQDLSKNWAPGALDMIVKALEENCGCGEPRGPMDKRN